MNSGPQDIVGRSKAGLGRSSTPRVRTHRIRYSCVRELKRQGLGSKVIADMFGLALSTYHDKVRRMSESQSYRGRSLWEAMFSFVQERETLLQADVLTRFRNDDEASVRAVSNDLVESGLVFRSGRAEAAVLRAARPEEVSLAGEQNDDEVASLVWLIAHRQGPATIEEIRGMVPVDCGRARGWTEWSRAPVRCRLEVAEPACRDGARALRMGSAHDMCRRVPTFRRNMAFYAPARGLLGARRSATHP